MRPLSTIKKDLEFNHGLSSLIEALKTIAVTQFRALERRIKSFEKLVLSIESFFELVDTAKIRHPFLLAGDKPQAVVAVTSDSGLLGGLNTQVINTALAQRSGRLIIIGGRGKAYLSQSKIPCAFFSGIRDDDRHSQAMQLRDYLLAGVLDGSFGGVKVVYPRPVSFTVQRVETVSLLPYIAPPGAGPAKGGIPAAILESEPGDIIEYLIRIWAGQKIYEIFGLSRLAEFAARFLHLEGSSQKLKEMDDKERLQYFRVRHELIDRDMRELFSARALHG